MTGRPSIWTISSLGLLGGLASVLILTNPGQSAYQAYATERLTEYLKEKVCREGISNWGEFLASQCHNLVDSSRPQFESLIAERTEQYNFFLFTIYQTEILLGDPLPSYQFSTVGLLQQFYVYQAERI